VLFLRKAQAPCSGAAAKHIFLQKKSATMNCNGFLSPVFMRVIVLKDGGGRGIRTPARFNPPVGFQDRSLQPDLGIPPYRQKIIYHI
jgi:hypothetical protein